MSLASSLRERDERTLAWEKNNCQEKGNPKVP